MAKKETNEKPRFKAEGMKVQNVRRLSEKAVAFSLNGGGLGLYNLRVVDGAKGKFISTPSEKGKDGKYYSVYAVYFDEKTEAAIIKRVEEIQAEADRNTAVEPENIEF